MQHRILWPVVGGVVLILALFGLIWAFGGYDGTSSTGGMGAAWRSFSMAGGAGATRRFIGRPKTTTSIEDLVPRYPGRSSRQNGNERRAV
jgi:hypothetical protein